MPSNRSEIRTIASAGQSSTAILLGRVQQGDGRARELLAERFLPILKRWAHGRLPARARGMIDTDDLVQGTIVRALERLELFEIRREGALVAYLRRILLNQLRDAIRRARPPELPGVENLVDPAPSPLEEVVGQNRRDQYEAALSRLSEAQREAVILRVEMGYSYQEVADATGSPSANAARMTVARGIQRLAKAFGAK